MTNGLITVVLVEDHLLLRDSFRMAFNEENGFLVISDVENADVVDNLCEKLRPDLLLMDVCTEGGASGLDALRRLRPSYPDMKIMMMSGFDELSYSPRARELGANAFIFKSKSVDFFLDMAHRIMEGETYFPEDRQIPLPNGEAPFTEREMEILRQLCLYKPRRMIAAELFISENTLKTHIRNMLAKTEFSSITDLLMYVVTNGWINPRF